MSKENNYNDRPGHHGDPHKPNKPEPPSHEEHMAIVYINGRPYKFPAKTELSFAEIVKLAFSNYDSNDHIVYTVTYSGGHHSNTQGVLVAGQSLTVKGGLIINVGKSTRS